MKKLFLLIVIICVTSVAYADIWTQKADFPGGLRADAWGFSIGNKGYVGGGSIADIWEYDPASNSWTEKAPPPYCCRHYNIAFSSGGYGFVLADSANLLFRFDPVLNSWTQMESMPGFDRILPACFVIGSKAYVGGGILFPTPYVPSDSAFYVYDITLDSWDTIAPCPIAFSLAKGLAIGNKGYVVNLFIGSDTGGVQTGAIYIYDPLSNTWTAGVDFPGPLRSDASACTIGGIGYFGLGEDDDVPDHRRDWWQYEPSSDTWLEKTSIPSSFGKDENTAFSIGSKGYIFFGSDIHPNSETWEYTPDSISTTATFDVANSTISFTQAPDPASTSISIYSDQQIQHILITDMLGKHILEQNFADSHVTIDVHNLPVGVYIVTVNSTATRRFVKK